MGAALHTVLVMSCGDLKLNHFIYSTATARASLDQRALVFLPGHAFDLPVCVHMQGSLAAYGHQHLYAARGSWGTVAHALHANMPLMSVLPWTPHKGCLK